jgi:hypothetical protein
VIALHIPVCCYSFTYLDGGVTPSPFTMDPRFIIFNDSYLFRVCTWCALREREIDKKCHCFIFSKQFLLFIIEMVFQWGLRWSWLGISYGKVSWIFFLTLPQQLLVVLREYANNCPMDEQENIKIISMKVHHQKAS